MMNISWVIGVLHKETTNSSWIVRLFCLLPRLWVKFVTNIDNDDDENAIHSILWLSVDPVCSYTTKPKSFQLTCNVSYRGQWKPDITCLPDSSDQVINIDDSQPGVVMYRKRVNITSNITNFIITCQASFNISDLDDAVDNVLTVSNTTPSSILLWNSSENFLPRELISTYSSQYFLLFRFIVLNRYLAELSMPLCVKWYQKSWV